MHHLKLLCVALLGVAMTASTMPATAAEPPAPNTTETATQFDQALEDVGAAPAAPNPDVDLPDDGQRKAGLDTDNGRVVMNLPVTEHLDDDGVTRVFDGRATDTMVAVSPTSDGMRALVSLETAQAPVRHRFAMGGDVALLVGDDEGNVHAFSADGGYLATAETPWAVDAEGREVPTRYEIDGTALVQIVDHRAGDYTYPITADPWWVPAALGAVATRIVVEAGRYLLRECLKRTTCMTTVTRGLGAITAHAVERLAAAASLRFECWAKRQGGPFSAKSVVRCVYRPDR